MVQLNIKKNLPYFVILFSFLIIILSEYSSGEYKKDNVIIASDVIEYYAYLPATFIYHDCSLSFVDTYKGPHKFVIWDVKHNGIRVIKTSMGLSMMYSPFFFIAHYYALHSHFDAGGYSTPYRVAIMASNFFFTILGLFFLSALLLRYFNPKLTTFIVLCYLF